MLKLVRDQIPPLSIPRNFFRHFCVKENENPKVKKKKSVKKKKRDTPSKNSVITDHLESIGSTSLIKHFTRKHFKVSSAPHNLYIADESAAKKFSEMIEKDIIKGSSPFVAEMNPGIGLLTEELLKTSIPKIHLFETSPCFLLPNSRLKLLIDEYPERLELRKNNLLKLWEAAFLDFKDGGNRFPEFLKGREKRKWNEEPYMKIVGAIPNEQFMRQLLMSVIFQNTFVEYGRIVFYLALPPLVWEKLVATKDSLFYRNRSVLFQVLFDYEKLGVLPRKSFLPWEAKTTAKRSKKLTELRELNLKLLYVVRIEPKADLFEKLNPEDLLRFFYFVKHNFQVKQTRIIPSLEQWVPHCGPKLIALDLNVYTEFMELSPDEVLKVYKEFSSWPEFETSHFLTCVTNFVSRIEEAVSNFDARFSKEE